MLEPERARRLAQAALRASSADETEVIVSQCDEELNRFTHDHPVQNQALSVADVSVRVRVNGREGKASTGTVTEDAIRRTVERAIDVARRMPAPAVELPPLPEAQGDYTLRSRSPLGVAPRATAQSVRAMTDACREQDCTAAGIQTHVNDFRLVLNSRGVEVFDVDTKAQVSLSAFRDDGAGWSNAIAADPELLDARKVAAQAVAKAVRSRDPQPVDPGFHTVVLEPAAVASLLLFAAYKGFGAQQVSDGSSFIAGKLGESVVGDNISIADDAFHPLAIGHVFDSEGVPRQRVSLIEGGVARGVVHDRRTAQKGGCQSTGHALPQPSSSGPLPQNLLLGAASGNRDDLIRDTDRGILVTEFHYTNMVEPTKLTLTGMTRNGTFRIDKGEIGPPVRNMRFTQSLVEALQHVTGLGGDSTLCSALFGGHTVVPSVRIEGFRFSSRTDF